MIKISKKIAATALAAAFGVGLLTQVDIFPNLDTYGVSVGTNNHYCSVESVHGSIEMSCEAVR
jgi:C4-dicarboxylate transporter